jgi:hydroxymethylpyrimidine pyrophosphatase-like HAD family hydrolase
MSHFAASQFAGPIPLAADRIAPTSAVDSPGAPRSQAERSFYSQYTWCLNPFLAIRDVIAHLQEELDRLVDSDAGWQLDEICKNIYLLGCSILDSVDDYLVGRTYDFSKVAIAVPPLGPIVSMAERLYNRADRLRLGSKRLARWRDQWQLALVRSLRLLLASPTLDKQNRVHVRTRLGPLLATTSLTALLHRRIRIPGAFRSQDLTHFDVLALGRKFTSCFPQCRDSIVIMGLRTAGSYFAPLLRSYLESHNCSQIDSFTFRPKAGASKREIRALVRCAAKRCTLVIIDEPVGKGNALLKAVQLAERCSVERGKIIILVPIHPSNRHCKSHIAWRLLSDIPILTLEPEEWHKYNQLDAATKEVAKEYFQALGLSVRTVTARGSSADRFNERLEAVSDIKGHTRLKRVYEVTLAAESGCEETRYVLAKSVGWGWLSYHAFLAGERLANFVPPVLGLRNGILYTEWQEHNSVAASEIERGQWIHWAASYIATRARNLRLAADPAPELLLESRNGLSSLVSDLCRAYGTRPAQYLRRGRMLYELSRALSTCPTLIDGKMRPLEWIRGKTLLLKSDFEQHGLGKIEINMTDPAYDLADAILTWQLSSEEEQKLVTRYIQDSGDVDVADRLLLNKLVAGIRARDAAIANLEDPRLIHRSHEFNCDYITAWNFLVLHTMRYCAGLCSRPDEVRWHGPLVVMDVDGVLDNKVLGFPSTTWAGIKAVSLLHSHDVAVILNTARSVAETKQYCEHYGFLGGVAEYGAFAWDAASNQEKILVSEESLHELQVLAEELRRIPGVFLNEDYAFSIRAYTFEGGITRALPTLLIQNLISHLKLDHLSFYQTFPDTAVVAKETDKGKGLLGLLELTGQTALPTLAIGDSEADLPMFAVAKNSYAPGHISCRSHARAIGCHIDPQPFQPGLLNIIRHIVHPEKHGCERCRSADPPASATQNLLLRLLQHADENQLKRLLRAMCDPLVTSSFLAS